MTDSTLMVATTTGDSSKSSARQRWEKALEELVPHCERTPQPSHKSPGESFSTSTAPQFPTQYNVADLIHNVLYRCRLASDRRLSYLRTHSPTSAQVTQMAAAEYWLLTKKHDEEDLRPKSEHPGLISTLEKAKPLAGPSELVKKLSEAQESATALAKQLEGHHRLTSTGSWALSRQRLADKFFNDDYYYSTKMRRTSIGKSLKPLSGHFEGTYENFHFSTTADQANAAVSEAIKAIFPNSVPKEVMEAEQALHNVKNAEPVPYIELIEAIHKRFDTLDRAVCDMRTSFTQHFHLSEEAKKAWVTAKRQYESLNPDVTATDTEATATNPVVEATQAYIGLVDAFLSRYEELRPTTGDENGTPQSKAGEGGLTDAMKTLTVSQS